MFRGKKLDTAPPPAKKTKKIAKNNRIIQKRIVYCLFLINYDIKLKLFFNTLIIFTPTHIKKKIDIGAASRCIILYIALCG